MSLRLKSVSYSISNLAIVSDVSLALDMGQNLAIIGPNGAGKTHVLKLALGLLRPNSGAVLLDDKDMATWSPKGRARLMSYIPQSPEFDWPLSVRDVVSLGVFAFPDLSKADLNARIAETLELCDLIRFRDRPITALSGGEKARVSMARALASRPKYLLADEPFAHLDVFHKGKLLDVLHAAKHKWGLGLMLSTHDLTLAGDLGGQYVALQSGCMFSQGSMDDLQDGALVKALFGLEGR